MEEKMETWDSALFTRALPDAAVCPDRDDIIIEFLIISGMFLFVGLLMHMDDIQPL